MSPAPVPVATLAPVPGPAAAPRPPSLPPAPAHLARGATGLGPLPGASLRISTIPQRYLLWGLIPAGVAVFLTLISMMVRWPGVR